MTIPFFLQHLLSLAAMRSHSSHLSYYTHYLYSVFYVFSRAAITKHHKLSGLTEVYHFTALEAKSLKSSCQQVHAPSEGFRKGSLLASCSSLACDSITPIFTWRFPYVHVSIFKFLLFIRTQIILN